MALAATLQRVLTAAWVGGIWAVGFLVAPTLFSVLARPDAGRAAAAIFQRLNILGFFIGASLVALWLYRRGRPALRARPFWLVIVMLALTAINHFGMAPAMTALRDASGAVPRPMAAQFGLLHGVSSGIFLLIGVLGLGLVVMHDSDEKAQ